MAQDVLKSKVKNGVTLSPSKSAPFWKEWIKSDKESPHCLHFDKLSVTMGVYLERKDEERTVLEKGEQK